MAPFSQIMFIPEQYGLFGKGIKNTTRRHERRLSKYYSVMDAKTMLIIYC